MARYVARLDAGAQCYMSACWEAWGIATELPLVRLQGKCRAVHTSVHTHMTLL